MVFGLALAAGVLGAATRAQVGPIEWSAERRLTIPDFKGTMPKSAQQSNVQQGALSFLRIEVHVQCRGLTPEVSARAVFLPTQSWWTGAQSRMWERVQDSKSWLGASRRDLEMKTAIKDANEELLKHEQLHFDMAEIAARKIRRRFAGSARPCTADGDSVELNSFVGNVTRDFRQEQALYDQETKHGTFLLGQARWESRVKTELTK